MVVAGSWCSPLLWGTAVTKVDDFWVLWCCIFILIQEEFGFSFCFFFLVEHFFTWFFVLKSRFSKQGCSAQSVPVKSFSGTWTTVLAMIALKENLTVLLLSVVPMAPMHEQFFPTSHASNILSKVPNWSMTAMENSSQRRPGLDWMAVKKRDTQGELG